MNKCICIKDYDLPYMVDNSPVIGDIRDCLLYKDKDRELPPTISPHQDGAGSVDYYYVDGVYAYLSTDEFKKYFMDLIESRNKKLEVLL